jgi:uncharacterized CHY-type Zn-finger protein
MVHWLCPNCQHRIFSATEFHQLRQITCIYCDTPFNNPFYRAPEAIHKESRA